MAPLIPAVITLHPTRSCFLFVDGSFIKQGAATKDITIVKMHYNDDKTAFFSCKVRTFSASTPSAIEVQLNSKYASLLGLKEKDKMLIEFMDKKVTHAEKVFLEPLNSDDWEMLHLNSEAVETNLMNQIRIVWKHQQFPVWANQTTFFVRVSQVVPNVEPCLLVVGTEICVEPKERHTPSNKSMHRKKVKRKLYDQHKHLRKQHNISSSSQDSPVPNVQEVCPATDLTSNTMSIIQYLKKSLQMNLEFQQFPLPQDKSIPNQSVEFHPLNFDFRLRTISFSQSFDSCDLPLALQSTTVFISEKTFWTHCDKGALPQCFVARLSKLLIPSDVKIGTQVISKDDRSKDQKNISNSKDKIQPLSEVIVNVVVLNHHLEDDYKVPEALFRSSDFVAIPLELKRRLGIYISCPIRLQGVDFPPCVFDTIILHPFEKLYSNYGVNLLSQNFNKWILDVNLQDSSLVLCNGTLVKIFLSKGKSCDFLVELVNSRSPSSPTNSSPHSIVSPDSDYSQNSETHTTETIKHLAYGYLNQNKLRSIIVKSGSYDSSLKRLVWSHSSTLNKLENLYQHIPALGIEAIGGLDDLFDKAMSDFELWFKLRPITTLSGGCFPCNGCMLIHGAKGVGKTTLVNALCKKLVNYPHFIKVIFIKCLPLRGKRVDTVTKRWESALMEATNRAPSLLVFENLDQLASAPTTPEQEGGQDGAYFSCIAQAFSSLVERIRCNSLNVAVIATISSLQKLHSDLVKSQAHQGKNVFDSIYEIQPPTVSQRVEILRSLVMSKLHLASDPLSLIEWTDVASKAEGFVAQDLDILVDRATYTAWLRSMNDGAVHGKEIQVKLIPEDFNVAISKYTAISLRGLQLQQWRTDKSWKSIGGMSEVKKEIQKILMWPVKYKFLFKNYTLKPMRNILLYGPPGTGKTLIASVVASECGMNFVSIKGPELLSKYIGASEQSVRDLFIRAMSAKPCILFFDEFDALAPRRGHDSTGVTDRVVNQLLTQMDGVESMEGVCVLAATSRPELIDPALLRPGRFDKCIYCSLPNENDRLEILMALSSKLCLSEDVDFRAIVEKTEHFSGADLQALLYSAQIEALHAIQAKRKRTFSSGAGDHNSMEFSEKMFYMPSIEAGNVEPSLDEAKKIEKEVDMIISNLTKENSYNQKSRQRLHSMTSSAIEQNHLLKVLVDMKPSVSLEERSRYQNIFKKFGESGNGEFLVSPKVESMKKVTLA